MLFFNFIGAGDVVAAALPNLKCLRQVTVCEMNPVAVLQTVDLCGKLQEVLVRYPKHCEVGMRCAYTDVDCVFTQCMCPDILVVLDKPVQ